MTHPLHEKQKYRVTSYGKQKFNVKSFALKTKTKQKHDTPFAR